MSLFSMSITFSVSEPVAAGLAVDGLGALLVVDGLGAALA